MLGRKRGSGKVRGSRIGGVGMLWGRAGKSSIGIIGWLWKGVGGAASFTFGYESDF